MRTGTTRPGRHDPADPLKTCAVCGSRLSAYNDNPTCWAHTPELPWKGPYQKPR